MRILVSGAREGFNQRRIDEVLDIELQQHGAKLAIIEGCARGVDTQAVDWARRNHVPVLHFPAPWSHLGKSAGPWRNRAMLRFFNPDLVICFHANIEQSRGTRDMLEEAKRRSVPARLIST